MSHLTTEKGAAGLWRFACAACETRSRRWWRYWREAQHAAITHSMKLHPEYHR